MLRLLPLLLIVGLTMAACKKEGLNPESVTPAQRAAGYSLLVKLLGQQKDVAKIFLIKREPDDLDRLIKAIAHFSGEEHKELEKALKREPVVPLSKDGDLPFFERETRARIENSTAKILLHAKGSEFELQLLLTQTDALDYGKHLAEALADTETDESRRLVLREIVRRYGDFHERVVAMIASRRS